MIVYIERDDEVYDVSLKLQTFNGIEGDIQRFIWNGKDIYGGKSFKEFGLINNDDALIYMVHKKL